MKCGLQEQAYTANTLDVISSSLLSVFSEERREALPWKVRQNESNRVRSENARRPKAKLFRQETGWREPNYAGVSVI
jgi:hypothetical protein